MIFGSGASERHPDDIHLRTARCGGLALLLALGACAGFDAGSRRAPEPEVAAAPAAPTDPLGRFAAEAPPGSERVVVLADGRSVRARLMRRYAAASGRDCSEVLVASAQSQRSTLLCATDGEWTQARPLLGGGRP